MIAQELNTMLTARSSPAVPECPEMSFTGLPAEIIDKIIGSLDLLDSRRLGCCSRNMQKPIIDHPSTLKHLDCFTAVMPDGGWPVGAPSRADAPMRSGRRARSWTAAALASMGIGLADKTCALARLPLPLQLAGVAAGLALIGRTCRPAKPASGQEARQPTPQDLHRSLARRTRRAHAACRALETNHGVDSFQKALELVTCLPARPALDAFLLRGTTNFEAAMKNDGDSVSRCSEFFWRIRPLLGSFERDTSGPADDWRSVSISR